MERAEAEAIFEQGKDVVVAVLLRMDEQIQALTAQVARQEERIAQLERRLGRNSRNSSQPPSADRPSTAPGRDKDSSGRERGAQPGHEGKGRPLLPAWRVDEFVDHWPVVAARLAVEAQPNEALVSAATRAAVGGRATSALGGCRELSLRGVGRPVSAWRLA